MRITMNRLLLVGCYLTTTQLMWGQSARTRLISMRTLNQELLRLDADTTNVDRARITQLLKSRSVVMEELIQSDPAVAQQQMLPEAVRMRFQAFLPEATSSIETAGEWSGRRQYSARLENYRGPNRPSSGRARRNRQRTPLHNQRFMH